MDSALNNHGAEMELQGITILLVMKVAGLLMLVTKSKISMLTVKWFSDY